MVEVSNGQEQVLASMPSSEKGSGPEYMTAMGQQWKGKRSVVV